MGGLLTKPFTLKVAVALISLACIVSGFAMNGTWGMEKLLDSDTALAIHQTFVWPLAGVVLVHAAASIYMAMRRWGWISKRTKI